MASPTQPQTPGTQPARRLIRCNATLGAQVRKFIDLDAEGESPPASQPSAHDSTGSLADFVVPDGVAESPPSSGTVDDPIEDADDPYNAQLANAFNGERLFDPRVVVLSSDSEDESLSDKRKEPDKDRPRMVLDEEMADEVQAAQPPAKRATPAPPVAAAAADAEGEDDPGEEVANKNNKYARWVWTWFHEGADYRPSTLPAGAEYLVYQEERCPHTGRLHLQGYIRYAKRLRWKQVVDQLKKDMPTVYVRKAKKPELACKRYCTKKASRVTEGKELGKMTETAGQQGHRSDLDSVIESCAAGKTLSEIAADNPHQYIKFHGGIEALHRLIGRDQTYRTEWRPEMMISVLWGPTNTGKTYRVLKEHPGLYQVNPGRDPWGDYIGQDVILLDEFDPNLWPLRTMNKICDQYPLTLDARYHNNFAAWTKVYIIANDPPSSWWMAEQPMHRNAFFRRICSVVKVTKRESDPDYDAELHCVPQPAPHIPEN